ncbi:hypothetical protein CPB86DRAFT_593367 [Serendipita vermifera]|nr:hypothetical protein CPB86DRAFT_593367 [Serendipita vermifera]
MDYLEWMAAPNPCGQSEPSRCLWTTSFDWSWKPLLLGISFELLALIVTEVLRCILKGRVYIQEIFLVAGLIEHTKVAINIGGVTSVTRLNPNVRASDSSFPWTQDICYRTLG